MKAPVAPKEKPFKIHENGVKRKTKMQQILTLISSASTQELVLKLTNSILVIFLGWLSFLSKFVDETDSTLIAIGLFILIISMAVLNFASAYKRLRSNDTKANHKSNYKGE
jgi:threonine/homoserine/homoserine lactone efflux protein